MILGRSLYLTIPFTPTLCSLASPEEYHPRLSRFLCVSVLRRLERFPFQPYAPWWILSIPTPVMNPYVYTPRDFMYHELEMTEPGSDCM
ncbi:hypothetical protein BD310DRAFT_915663 [Dichomitus squalens]|uniref:Uncharacterized protein n=1 Tax=Dichomitus squalens TaxID=114155 RepID=A0A4Q9Q883_9APHY|nr:hypothetical protein BD310DRAFT_915663 [Dichomitus squalens]